jgi:sulfate permease, SulP family
MELRTAKSELSPDFIAGTTPRLMARHDPQPLSNTRGDLAGALAAAMITLPMSIGYGILAFAPLGKDFASQAALFGIYSAVLCGLFAAVVGGNLVQITGPGALMTLVLATVVAALADNPSLPVPRDMRVTFIVGMASLCVLVGGLCQVLLGTLRLGGFVKYVPYPVISGLMNGIGFLVLVSQLKPLLGVPEATGFGELLARPAMIQPVAVLVGLMTLTAIVWLRRCCPALPAPLVGLTAGTALYHALCRITNSSCSMPVVGPIHFQWPVPDKLMFLSSHLGDQRFWKLLPPVLITGCVLGILGSLESLLSASVADDLTGHRHEGNRELMGQGSGNIAGSLIGAIAGSGSMVRTAAIVRAGGRTRLSAVMCSVFLLMVVAALAALAQGLPMAAVAGVMVYIGFNLFDHRPIQLVRTLWSRRKMPKDVLNDLVITLAVAIIAVSVNVVAAAASGMVFASIAFLTRMGRCVIRREYSGDTAHSRKTRSLEQTKTLEGQGHRIVVLELQGALFFASVESLARGIEATAARADFCIIDLRRVTEVDSTGTRTLLLLRESLEQKGKCPLVSHAREDHRLFDCQSMAHAGDKDGFFADTDAALECAEEELLAQAHQKAGNDGELSWGRLDLVAGFTREEIDELASRLTREVHQRGTRLICEGDAERDLFILAKGSVTVKTQMAAADRCQRYHTLGPGSVFGEMALLDGEPRSADVWSEEDIEVLRLSPAAFDAFSRERQVIYGKLLLNLSRIAIRNLRKTNEMVRLLE